jgi:hypothetical protein
MATSARTEEAYRDRVVMRVVAGKIEAASRPTARADTQRQEDRMKHYLGDRTIDGVKVTVDGASLDPRVDVMEFTKNGFEWSYEGPEPRQLALALLVDHLGDNAAAMTAVETFMRAIVANFENEWEMTSDDIDLALTALDGKAVA